MPRVFFYPKKETVERKTKNRITKMSDDKSKINRVRLICEFIKLTSFDSESFNEEKISEYLKEKLKELGLKAESDTASEILKKISTGTSHPASNIYATLKGNKAGPPVLFSAHMDTVKPGIRIYKYAA